MAGIIGTASLAAAVLPALPLPSPEATELSPGLELARPESREPTRSLVAGAETAHMTGPTVEAALVSASAESDEQQVAIAPVELAVSAPGLCDTKLRLSAILYDSRRPERSSAVLGLRMPRSATFYRRGARVSEYELVKVHPRGVLLRRDDRACWLRIMPADRRPERAAAHTVKAKPRQRARGRAAFSARELDTGVHKLGPASFRVERELLKQALARANKIARATRVTYQQHQGRPVGVRLRRIARDGLLARLGLQRGDNLRTINGLELASAAGMLGARALLPTAKRLSLAIERKGKPVTLEYEIP
jgi:general secretion pathway protein C